MIPVYSFQIDKSFAKFSIKEIPPIWQIILFSDGSLTRHLEILLGSSINLKIQQISLTQSKASADKFVCSKIYYPQISRQVWLSTKERGRIVYANSIWNRGILLKFLNGHKKNLPLGISFIESELDIFKQIYKIESIYSLDLETHFNNKGPFWSRYYFLIHHGKIVASIQEIFSPSISY